MEKAKVYFTKKIEPASLVRLYDKLNVSLPGKVAVKVHSGEEGNQNYLEPSFMKDIIERLSGVVVECNTAYEGMRDTSLKHKALLTKHGFDMYDVDIMDEHGEMILDINNGKQIKKNYVGSHLANYDSMLVLSHFKGHPMGGYGGALKQLSIGCASSKGKRYIHCIGKENGSYEDMFGVDQLKFLQAMADAASSVVDFFKGNIVYINVLKNLSVDCDCCAVAKDPCMKDIGIVISTDPVAIDKACIDLVKKSDDPGKEQLLERIASLNGEEIINDAALLGIGTSEYELIDID